MIQFLRVLEVIAAVQAVLGLLLTIYLVRNDVLTKRWLKAQKINSYLEFTVRFDMFRHSLGAGVMAIYFVVSLISIWTPFTFDNLNPRSLAVPFAFVITEWLIVTKNVLDAVATYRLLNYHGLRRP